MKYTKKGECQLNAVPVTTQNSIETRFDLVLYADGYTGSLFSKRKPLFSDPGLKGIWEKKGDMNVIIDRQAMVTRMHWNNTKKT